MNSKTFGKLIGIRSTNVGFFNLSENDPISNTRNLLPTLISLIANAFTIHSNDWSVTKQQQRYTTRIQRLKSVCIKNEVLDILKNKNQWNFQHIRSQTPYYTLMVFNALVVFFLIQQC